MHKYMALTEKQKEILNKYTSTRTSVDSINPDVEMVSRLRSSLNLDGGFMGGIKSIGTGITESLNKRVSNVGEIKSSKAGPIRQALQTFGQGAGFVSDAIGSTVMGGIKAVTPDAIEKSAGGAIKGTVQAIAQTEPAQKLIQGYMNLTPERQKDIEAILGVGSLALDVAGLGVAGKGVKAGSNVVKEGIETGIDMAKPIVKKGIKATKEAIKPTPTPIKALGEVLYQGKEKVISPQTLEDLSKVKIEKVKTFKDLESSIATKQKDLMKVVDKDLGVDKTPIKLKDLTTIAKTTGGATVKSNYVRDAISHLKQAYTKIGDKVKATEMGELFARASKNGLTRKEINDLARSYGAEFGSKAFSKIGEPLTSVNAKLFENTRKGLKDIARSGLKGNAAKKADMLYGRLENVKGLVRKNIESVNKLKNTIQERGLLEKVGHGFTKYADVLTGGGLRGFVGGLLPRGAGYKTLNALDLEELLARNLKIIKEASQQKTTKQFKEVIKKLEAPIKK